jgi:uncharacterized glyoxalase superfamily protein PhnB
MSTSSTALCGSAPVFVVRDVLASVAHYRDVLGFRTEFAYGEPTFYAGVERDGVVIHLQAARASTRTPGQSAMNVFVTDADALYQELRDKGARLVNEPTDRPYGMRDFNVHDVDGNELCFGMELPPSPSAA